MLLSTCRHMTDFPGVFQLHSPGQVPLRMNSHVDEERAKDQQVGPVVDGVLYQRRFDFPGDGEASRASVRLHERQQQPEDTQQAFNKPQWKHRSVDGSESD